MAAQKIPPGSSVMRRAEKNNSSWFYRFATISEQKKIIPFGSIATQLDVQTSYCVLAASALMRRLKIPGVEQHCRFNRLVRAGVRTESDLRSWMQESFPALNASLWENCRKQADEFLETGVKVFRWGVPFSGPITLEAPSQSGAASCPAVLFGKGGLNSDLPLLAVFNSRKPRLISPDSNWLKALRFFFALWTPGKSPLQAARERSPTIWPARMPCAPDCLNSWSRLFLC